MSDNVEMELTTKEPAPPEIPAEASKSGEVVPAKPAKQELVSFSGMFVYADNYERFLMAVGLVAAVGHGIIVPLISLVMGDAIGAFIGYGQVSGALRAGASTPAALEAARVDLYDKVFPQIIKLAGIGVAGFVSAYILQTTWQIAGERQAHRVRRLFLTSILKQDVSFFDKNQVGDLTTRLSSDTTVFQEGISEKVSRSFSLCVTFITGFTLAFVQGWLLTLVLLAVTPLIGVAAFGVGKIIAAASEGSAAAYAKAGNVAQETLANIRTVTVFNGQERAVAKFSVLLDEALKRNEAKSWKTGVGFGTLFGLLFCMYALAFGYGSTLVINGTMQGQAILQVVFAIIIGAFSLIGIGPLLQAIAKARGVAVKIFEVIETKPQIVSGAEQKKLEKVKGKIEFRNVSFAYPSRPDVVVLKNFNLVIEPGTSVALVGFSGSGKSTTIQLLERFYEPFEGEILLDDIPIKDFDIKWLRQQIGLVSQEPILFDATIEQNIKFGSPEGVESTIEEVQNVTKIANAHDFISKLADKYHTRTGERGALLSGGQKQRIAIARSLLCNPQILLLDEATSALDTESEKLVQVALENAAKNRTTLTIAHRLSTIKDCNKIVVLEKGVVMEQGTHADLIALNGQYAALVKAQELKSRNPEEVDLPGEKAAALQGVEIPGAVAIELKSPASRASKLNIEADDGLTEEERKKAEMLKIIKENKTPLWDVFMLQMPNVHFVALGVLSSGCNGAILPLFGLFFGEILTVFASTDPDKIRSGAFKWSMVFLGLAAANLLCNIGQFGGMGVAGERLTKRIRLMAFKAMLRQDISYFDDKLNGTGFLTARLSDEAEKIQGLMGPTLGSILQFTVSLAVALIGAFSHSWQMTLAVLAVIPLLVVASLLENKLVMNASGGAAVRRAYSQASQTCCDAIANIRTVKSLTIEPKFVAEYMSNIDIPYKLGLKKAFLGSIGYGFSQGAQYWMYAITFTVAYYFITRDIIQFESFFPTLFSILFGAISFSNAIAFGPDVTKARVAAINFYQLINRVPSIDSENMTGEKPVDVQGEVSLNKAKFAYPQRLDNPILKGINLNVKPGQNVALVGMSGSGKSTIFQLVTRFYDVVEGSVEVERLAVPNWNVAHLRRQIAIVSQEPSLFIGSIAENIKYGRPEASQEDIEDAAKLANIHGFISELPEKYDTEISNSKLSGGQKQRISIARALICKPKLLLLDEATSALDSESEKLVQDALVVASKGRTTFTIAHRLSSIQDCDLIIVMREGVVVEQGQHFDLIDMNGVYASLVKKQQLSGTGGM